jgi:prepilin-type N-terminal cleavage/methylation domain-containing protein
MTSSLSERTASKAAKDTILTSRTGNDAFKRGARWRAFTLIELLVVLSILSILMFIITPRFAAIINPERAKNFVLTLQNSLRYLNEKAILEQQVYLFNFDLDEGRYYFSMVGEEDAGFGEQEDEALVPDHFLKPGVLPVRLNVEKVVMIPGEGVSSGKVTVPFTPNGMMFSFEMVFVSDDGSIYLLAGNSYSGRIRLFVSQDEENWVVLE